MSFLLTARHRFDGGILLVYVRGFGLDAQGGEGLRQNHERRFELWTYARPIADAAQLTVGRVHVLAQRLLQATAGHDLHLAVKQTRGDVILLGHAAHGYLRIDELRLFRRDPKRDGNITMATMLVKVHLAHVVHLPSRFSRALAMSV